MSKIVLINYGMGNIGSVIRKLNRIGISPVVTTEHEKILTADKIILPGVGHFGSAMQRLKTGGVCEALTEAVMMKKIPILGICLGMQLMAKHSEEGDSTGLGWIDAEVIRFIVGDPYRYKIPHMGWNHIMLKKDSSLIQDVDLEPGFYFVHSYHMRCNDPSDILSITEYDIPFVSSIQKENIFGVQFHPEKSHDAGEKLLKNFINL